LADTPAVAKHLTIGQLAEAAGVPTSTVRYYERAKLLKPSARSPSNYRLYSASDLERLRFIRAAQATGFTLDDVTKLLRPAPCGSVQHLIEDRLDEIGERTKELRHVQKVLRAALAECQGHASSGRCKVVDDLSARAKRPP
jgi:DNA-binding transcriptional MerR regulator